MNRYAGLLVLFFALAIPVTARAAVFSNPLTLTVIREVFTGFIMSIIYVGTPVLVAFIVWTGFLFVAAQGNDQGLRKAKQMAVYVAIGGFLLLALWGLVRIIGNTLAGFSAASLLVVLAAFLLYVLYKKR
jgi:hypothetical protein